LSWLTAIHLKNAHNKTVQTIAIQHRKYKKTDMIMNALTKNNKFVLVYSNSFKKCTQQNCANNCNSTQKILKD